MADVVVEGKLLRWGNSYGVRIKKDDVEESGLEPGQEILLRIESSGERIPVTDPPTFQGGSAEAGERHDAILGEARSEEHAGPPDEASTGDDDEAGGEGR